MAISRDGSQVAFWDGGSISLASTGGGTPRLFCEKCGRPDGWTQDGKVIISPGLDLDSIGVRDPVTSVFTKIISDPVRHSTAPDLSRDGKWLTFHTAENVQSPGMGLENRRQVFLSAAAPGRGRPPESWISVTDGSALDREPKWSTDGNRIYFLYRIGTGSAASGRGIWMQRRNSRWGQSILSCTCTIPTCRCCTYPIRGT